MKIKTIFTTKDTYSRQEYPTANYGTETEIDVANDAIGVQIHKRAYLGFDITDAAESAYVTGAQLHIYYSDSSGGQDLNSYIRRITGNWTETGLTWNIAPSITSNNQVLKTFPAATYGWYTIDITDLYKDAKDVSTELGLRIESLTDYDEWWNFRSLNYGNGSYKAYITISYTHEIQKIYVTKDTYDEQEDGNANFGTATEINVIHDETGTHSHKRAYFGFDITNGELGGSVAEVKLHVYYNNSSGGGALQSLIKRITGSWSETGLTWNNAPGVTTIGQAAQTYTTTGYGWYETDITKMYRDAKASGNEFGIRIEGQHDLDGYWWQFRSKEYSSGAYKAYIEIVYDPLYLQIHTFKDTYSNQGNPSFNYCNNNEIQIKGNYWSTQCDGYVEFDITNSPPAGVIKTVHVHMHKFGNDDWMNVKTNRITSTWAEDTLTWNNKPTDTSTNQVIFRFPSGTNNWFNYEITDLYKDAKNVGNELGLRLFYTTDTDNYEIGSFECQSGGEDWGAYIVIVTEERYVKTTGDDALDGLSWTNAWATINKAATTAIDGTVIHIGFGTYNAEPVANKIAPQNAGTTGIKYLCEIETTGGGIGDVVVEKN